MLWQVSMAEFGIDIPQSRKPEDATRRREIFDIISPYCFTKEDIAEIESYPEHVQDMWLQTFSNSQSVMVRSKVLLAAKEYFRKYFPDNGGFPKASWGQKLGLSLGETVLDRYDCNV